MVDGTGATLLPGLIGAHTHTRTVAQLQDALRFGVTTVLDMWTPEGDRALRDAAARRDYVATGFKGAGVATRALRGHELGLKQPPEIGRLSLRS